MSAPRRLRFVQQLGLLGVSIAVPMMVLVGTFVYLCAGKSYQAIEAEVGGRARSLAQRLDGELDKIVVTLQVLTRLSEAGVDFAHLRQAAGEIAPASALTLHLYQVKEEPLPGTTSNSATVAIEDRGVDSYIAAIAANTPVVSDLISDRTTDRKVWKVAAPVYRDGVWSGVMELTALPSLVSHLLQEAAFPAGWQWEVFDRRGTLIWRSPDGQNPLVSRPAETQGVTWSTDADNNQVIRAHYRTNVGGWSVAVNAPAHLLSAPIWNAAALLGATAATLLMISCALFTRQVRRLAADVRRIQEATEGSSPGTVRSAAPISTHEFQDLLESSEKGAAERQRSKDQLDWLTLELQHRTNNLLAVVSSIARHTLLNGRSITDAREAFLGRLHALANASASLAQANWAGAEISEVITKELSAFQGRYSASGPQVLLSPQAAQNVSLIIHELVTNAFRHGALSTPAGHVAITWQLTEGASDRQLEFQWVERGGPVTLPPARLGFGTTFLRTVLTESGAPELKFEAQGFTYRTHLPLEGALAEAA